MGTAAANPKNDTRKDVYEIVTGKIIEQLEKGTVPWRKPWADSGVPKNLLSKRAYRGVNLLLLSSLGYEQNYFVTSKQLKEIDGSIKPDEKPHLVVYWNFAEKEPAEAEKEEKAKKKAPFLRYYTVYNVAQCAGIPPELMPATGREPNPIPACESVVKEMSQRPDIRHKEASAFYDCLEDYVNMPKQKTFESDESYYSTLFHELVHSTGHHTRLNRMGLVQMTEFGSEPYSQEELVAEIGTCYLQSLTGITSEFDNSAAYIQGWLKKLNSDKHFIVTAASHAQKAIDFILNVELEEAVAVEE
jgi:antirestriction protein ArdC